MAKAPNKSILDNLTHLYFQKKRRFQRNLYNLSTQRAKTSEVIHTRLVKFHAQQTVIHIITCQKPKIRRLIHIFIELSTICGKLFLLLPSLVFFLRRLSTIWLLPNLMGHHRTLVSLEIKRF
ncbi:hypothetical protein [Hugenholtzia roseola]|uniref:hypothetical protein n=1 Tax=Hugenholtzia roseola TaxID=1002 RepID=UPI0012B5AF1E|nr:hypothetical protein [Hugenholtzia roseola]